MNNCSLPSLLFISSVANAASRVSIMFYDRAEMKESIRITSTNYGPVRTQPPTWLSHSCWTIYSWPFQLTLLPSGLT